MGREVRMVPPNWEHPKKTYLGLRGPEQRCQPMFDKSYEQASSEWIKGFIKWHVAKEYPDYACAESRAVPYWEWDGMPPDKEYYRPWKDNEATWFQVWETVSEGTPVTPPFATREELIRYLAEHGDFWDQSRGDGPWGYENAAKFVGVGWAPSFILVPNAGILEGASRAADIEAAMEMMPKEGRDGE